MTLPPVIRIFFALALPEAAKEDVGTFIGVLKKKSKTHAIRWARAENLHITLQFLAKVETEHLGNLIEKVRAQIEGIIQHTTITFGSLSLFPNPFRPRVIVLDILPQEHVAALAASIGEGINRTTYQVDSRPFRAHLTLGRIKQPHGLDLGFLHDIKVPHFIPIEVSEVVLFRSEPLPEGSTYTVLETIRLA